MNLMNFVVWLRRHAALFGVGASLIASFAALWQSYDVKATLKAQSDVAVAAGRGAAAGDRQAVIAAQQLVAAERGAAAAERAALAGERAASAVERASASSVRVADLQWQQIHTK